MISLYLLVCLCWLYFCFWEVSAVKFRHMTAIYLRRGGRLSAAVAFIGKTIKLSPVMTLTEDCRRLTASAVKRSFKQALAHVADELAKREMGDGTGWRIYVVHGEAPEKAEEAKGILAACYPKAEYVLSTLTPAFITQGGPGCVAVQSIKLV